MDQLSLNSAYTFENYKMNPANQFAYALAFDAAEKVSLRSKPLFIYGEPGSGKTHLLHAVGNKIKNDSLECRIKLIHGEDFVNSFIESIRNLTISTFRDDLRKNTDVLLVDDIQYVMGKERSEEEFFHTVRTLLDLKKLVIFASDRAADKFEGISKSLIVRIKGGSVCEITKEKRAMSDFQNALNIDPDDVQKLFSFLLKNFLQK